MKKPLFHFAVFALACLAASPSLRAQCMLNSTIAGGFTSVFPNGISGFGIVGPNANGDYLILGTASTAAMQTTYSLIPLPNVAGGGQQFCNTIAVTSAAMYFSYVPTAAERSGDFSAFAAQFANLPDFPFPDGIFGAGATIWGWRIPAGESVFVSSGGSQILKLDGNTGNLLQVVHSGSEVSYEGLAVGPDAKVYVADPFASTISRMNQDGSNFENVYSLFPTCSLGACPENPQGLSFPGGTGGDLYFNTSLGFSGVFKVPGAAAANSVAPFSPTATVIPSCATEIGSCIHSAFGEGTGFNGSNDLLIVDVSGGRVLSSPPPYTTVAPLATDLTLPTAVAVNRLTGGAFVSDTGTGNILALGGEGPTVYANFGSSACPARETALPERPLYMQFDGTGRLFVVTQQYSDGISQIESGGDCGKLWRVDPPATPGGPGIPTLLRDFTTFPCCTVESNHALGLAVPASSPESESIVATGNAQTLTFSFDNNNYGVSFTIPAGFLLPGTIVTDTPADTPQSVWAAEADNYSGTTIAPIDALNGDGIVHTVTLTCPSGMPTCEPPAADTYSATIFWESSQIDFCTLSPGLLKEEIGTLTWFNLEQGCTNYPDPGHGISGSSNDSLSRWAAVSGVPPTPTATVTITTPANGATYVQGQVVAANYSCTGPSVVACAGTVGNTQNIDTSLGTHTFSANALVNLGPGGSASATYSVVQNFVFVGFQPPVNNPPALNVAKGGQAIPVGFQVLDSNNNLITSMTMPPVSIVDVQESCSNLDSLMLATLADATASGSSGFQNLGGGFYQFNWKTSKAWAGTCRQLQVNLGDGILHVADFRFK